MIEEGSRHTNEATRALINPFFPLVSSDFCLNASLPNPVFTGRSLDVKSLLSRGAGRQGAFPGTISPFDGMLWTG